MNIFNLSIQFYDLIFFIILTVIFAKYIVYTHEPKLQVLHIFFITIRSHIR